MEKLKDYDINFSGLKNGRHEYNFDVKQTFFDLFETEIEFSKSNILANIILDKHTTFIELIVKVSGTVELVCDISNENYNQPIENEIKVLVKFGNEFDDSDPDVITIPFNSSEINVAQLIYEDVLLSIPMKKISPNLSKNKEYTELLEKFSPQNQIEIEKIEPTEVDPRWEALKKLKGKN